MGDFKTKLGAGSNRSKSRRSKVESWSRALLDPGPSTFDRIFSEEGKYARWLDNGGIEMLGAMGRVVAARSRVPVSLLLNEVQTLDQAVRGMDAGFNAVMVDTSAWPWDEHMA